MAKREVLTEDQVAFYAAQGYLLVENRIPDDIIQQIRDRNGNSLTFDYGGQGRLNFVTATLGRKGCAFDSGSG